MRESEIGLPWNTCRSKHFFLREAHKWRHRGRSYLAFHLLSCISSVILHFIWYLAFHLVSCISSVIFYRLANILHQACRNSPQTWNLRLRPRKPPRNHAPDARLDTGSSDTGTDDRRDVRVETLGGRQALHALSGMRQGCRCDAPTGHKT